MRNDSRKTRATPCIPPKKQKAKNHQQREGLSQCSIASGWNSSRKRLQNFAHC